MSDEIKTRLQTVEADLRGMREDKASAVREKEAAKETYAEVIAGDGDEKEAHQNAMEAVAKVGELDDKITNATAMQVDLLKLLGDKETAAAVKSATPGLESTFPGVAAEGGMGWDSGSLLASEEIQERLDFIAKSKSAFGHFELGAVADREAIVADLMGGGVMAADILPQDRRAGIPGQREAARRYLPAVRRPFTFLNLIPVGTTDGNLIPYTQENPITGASEARNVAEGALKPEATGPTYTDADAPVRTIAAWMKTRKQALSDYAALRSIMDSRLRFMVQKRLEEQVLDGDGAGVNLLGIRNTPGIGSVAYNANVPTNEQVLSGITNIYLNDGAADGLVINPIDWQRQLTQKAQNAGGTAGSYDYYGGGPFGTTPNQVWGVRAIPSPIFAQGEGMIADFGLGAQVLIREGVNVLFSDSDQDDFIRNRVTLLAEMRAALIVWRPALFQEIAFA